MKVLIINEYAPGNTNYGNCLQSYAMSNYITYIDKSITVEVAHIIRSKSNSLQTKFYTPKDIIIKCCNRIRKLHINIDDYPGRDKRVEAVNSFIERNIPISYESFDYEGLKNSKYDTYVVGSDVVWAQRNYKFNKIKFLDFPKDNRFKISYAASFGRDWIPPENIKHVKRCLSDFDFISVRESSSVDMLASYGISAIHVLDPTLLLGKDEWQKLEIEPEGNFYSMHRSKKLENEHIIAKGRSVAGRYVFVYILGADKDLYNAITLWANRNELTIVTIPYASGEYNTIDSEFGDVQISDCSPENWIWLIHHAEYIVTDSFHGTVFSTIFEKKFFVVERRGDVNINNRMIDYLKTIHQLDKMIQYTMFSKIDDMKWDYDDIKNRISKKQKTSIEYLQKALRIS